MSEAMTFQQIKELAKEQGCRVDELFALARNNDPYFVGTPSQIAQAEWFATIWESFGYQTGVHLRRIHYKLVSQDPLIARHDGKLYVNDESSWTYLGGTAKYARYLGLVPADGIVDRRNPDPLIFADESLGEPGICLEPGYGIGLDLSFPCFPSLPLHEVEGYVGRQAYLLEVWCEKSTMNDILIPLCERYEANLVTGLGELSITAMLAAARRIRDDGRPARIFYITDFDPAGQCMPISASRKLEFYLAEEGVDADVRLFPIALTEDQCKRYRLPRQPIQGARQGATDAGRAIWDGRRKGFEERYGEGATELDALEALHPGSLRQIVQDALLRYYDTELGDRVWSARHELMSAVAEARDNVLDEHEGELGKLQAEYGKLKEEFEERANDLGKRQRELYRDMLEEVEDALPDLEDYPIPEADTAHEDDEALFDSRRSYLEQMDFYKRAQRKTS